MIQLGVALFHHRWRLAAIWGICLCLSTAGWGEQSYFNGELKLPTLEKFELFTENPRAVRGQQRWDLKVSEATPATGYLLANPADKLWVTVRKASSSARISRDSPLNLKDFDKKLVPQLASHNIKATTTQYGKSAAGPAVVYQFRDVLPKGRHAYLVCLTPSVDNSPKVAYLVTIVCTDSSQPKAIKLVEKILKGAWIAPS